MFSTIQSVAAVVGLGGKSSSKKNAGAAEARASEMHTATLEHMAFAREQTAAANAKMAQAIDAQVESLRQQNEIAEKQLAIASERHTHWQTFFKPIEQSVAAQAREGVDVQGAQSRAASDVNFQFDQAQNIQQRTMGRMGIDPNSGRYISGMRDVSLARAAATAGVMNQARLQSEQINWDRRMQAAALGQGMPMQTAQIMGSAGQQIGQAGANMANTYAGAAGVAMQGAQLSNQQANMTLNSSQFERQLAQGYRNEAARAKSGLFGGIGGLIGMGAGFALSGGNPIGGMAGAAAGSTLAGAAT